MLDKTIEIAEELIAIPGCAELPEKETKVAEKLCAILRSGGVETELIHAASDRLNLLAVHRGTGGGRSLLLCTHLDTVPAYEMVDAFAPAVRDGRLYGRGAVDVKDILAAMAVVMLRLAREKTKLAGDVLFLAVADEESGSMGMRHAVRDPRVIGADFAIIGEPSGLDIGIAHKGVAWFEAVFHGKATHGGSPEKGVNAVYHAMHFVNLLTNEMIPELDNRIDPLLGRATMNVGVVRGGTRPTIVPDTCTVQWDRRILPAENYAGVSSEYLALLERLKAEDPQVKYDFSALLGNEKRPFPPLSTLPDDPCVQRTVRAAHTVLGREPRLAGLSFWTDAALFSATCGKPAVVFGPGSIEQAHSNNEYVPLCELEKAVCFYYDMAAAFCGREGGQ
ncbi:MAG: M20 family metallopeptidase [Candidatus Limiplasma sp.]|nr:M20 family metallopeptidase [Candidatus Limiplasma sp.]